MAGTRDLDPAITSWRDAGAYHHWEQGGCDVFYRDIGDPDAAADHTLLLIHGFPESSFSYHKVIEPLRQRFDRIVLVDFPGFGLSDKPEHLTYSLMEQADALLSVWRQNGLRGGHVLAHDMGDSVLTELIARATQDLLPAWFDEGLQSVTFTDGNMVMEKAALVPMQVLLRKPGLGRLLNGLTNARLFRNQVARANGVPMDPLDIERMWQLNARRDGHRLAWKIIRYLDERDRFQNSRWLKALSRFSRPIHICWGAADRVSPPAVAHHLKSVICPDARLTLMDGVGHFCQLQDPAQWSKAVLDFYATRSR